MEALVVSSLRKSYRQRRGVVQALAGASFRVDKGQVVGLLGENGSGKTTLVKCIASVVPFDSGAVQVCGYDVRARQREVIERTGAVFPGGRNVYWRLTPRENVEYFAAIRGVKRSRAAVDSLLASLGLFEVRDEEVRRLSTGMKQRVAIACGMTHDPEILLLDEPTLGLDVGTVDLIAEWLGRLAREGRGTILVTSHDMAFVERVCERIVVLHRGRIVTDETAASLEEQLGTRRRLSVVASGRTVAELERVRQSLGADASLTQQGTRVVLRCEAPSAFLGQVIPALVSAGATIEDVAIEKQTISDLARRVGQ